ncbi:hypothetical protein LEP1GSC199_3281 [Leptospira vanthielii serovar Holland str. Waz Holland = ATCC 700522]|uniref:Uncharacterized protein n=1 Tax=Leptospira vanthielii serovar Holland str. Waz Holland = ATCC 700522 TaxID=1218591 RepID=N1WAU8_9LEPT|nr:hypothetical protein LEP1GSC199_3281 [Leptospira vanthielii serovar Holland str. Waz Holland = ATCC 700522]
MLILWSSKSKPCVPNPELAQEDVKIKLIKQTSLKYGNSIKVCLLVKLLIQGL